MFGKGLFRFKTFDFQKEMNSVRESDDEIGFVSVRNTGVFIRNAQPKMVIPDIALYIFSVFQPETGGTFPRFRIQHDLIDVTLLRSVTWTRREELHVRRCAGGFITVQYR